MNYGADGSAGRNQELSPPKPKNHDTDRKHAHKSKNDPNLASLNSVNEVITDSKILHNFELNKSVGNNKNSINSENKPQVKNGSHRGRNERQSATASPLASRLQ